MANNSNLRLNRQQLAQFLPSVEAIKAFEQLFSNTLDTIPNDLESVEFSAQTAQLQAAEALGKLAEIANALSLALYGAYQEATQQDIYSPPFDQQKGEDFYIPPISISKTDVGLSNVENTALSTWQGSSNLTTLGTVVTGTWNATPIPATKGGTGLTFYTANRIPYADTSTSLNTSADLNFDGSSLMVGTTSGNGVYNNSKQVVGGIFKTVGGFGVTFANGANTLFTMDNIGTGQTWLVYANCNGNATTAYHCLYVVTCDNTATQAVQLVKGSLSSISVSGNNIVYTQTSGGSQAGGAWNAIRLS